MHPASFIPGYDLLTRLGGGTVTSVYSARDLATDQICAVKLLRPDWEDQTTAIKLLQREARAAMVVKHPHLLTLQAAHVMKPPYFLVMDLLQGESLRGRLRREYQVPIGDAVWITRQVTEALTTLHRKGFMHGDIKPDNIFLTHDGRAVLLDLGFSHRAGENAGLLKQGYVMGTVEYLAPELCVPEPVDMLASDLFSFGVTLFEMLTGQLPYARGTIRETIRRHARETPADIREFCPRLPPALANLVDRLLVRWPEKRPRPMAVVQQLIAVEIASLHSRRAA